jgi:chromatin segregation and condensation protein Rec8/ScpA/Scc1 (kleisin family)
VGRTLLQKDRTDEREDGKDESQAEDLVFKQGALKAVRAAQRACATLTRRVYRTRWPGEMQGEPKNKSFKKPAMVLSKDLHDLSPCSDDDRLYSICMQLLYRISQIAE